MKRENILLTVLFAVDQDIVPKEMILYLDENVPRDKAITPSVLNSCCMMFIASFDTSISKERETRIKDNLVQALSFAWQHNDRYLMRVTKLQRNKMRGWRISRTRKSKKN